MAEHCPKCRGEGCPGIVSAVVEQAAVTAEETTRRKLRPEQRDQVYHSIVGLCNNLEMTGKLLRSGRELAILLSGLVVGEIKLADAVAAMDASAAKVERKVPGDVSGK